MHKMLPRHVDIEELLKLLLKLSVFIWHKFSITSSLSKSIINSMLCSEIEINLDGVY